MLYVSIFFSSVGAGGGNPFIHNPELLAAHKQMAPEDDDDDDGELSESMKQQLSDAKKRWNEED